MASIDPPESPLDDIFARTRRNLLDLSLRNRLINTPLGSTRSRRLDIVDEPSDEVFRLLVREQKSFTFLPAIEKDREDDAEKHLSLLGQPDDEPFGAVATRHLDTCLQTKLSSEDLQSRLLSLYFDARTFEEEQGVSSLYLAMGFLEWYEADASDKPRFAPLLLIPADLARPTVTSKFKLTLRDDELATNLSLKAKLQKDFEIPLPEIADPDEVDPGSYYRSVEMAIAGQTRWKVHRDKLVLWFFSFAKYLMYRDLDPSVWPQDSPLTSHPLIRGLLNDGFSSVPPVCGESESIDAVIPPGNMIHVTDADSSQALVIEEVRQGRNLVVQGPPGTGKSQTITNIIATAVKEGKRVLFVAEKMAALEVVKSRLDRLDLGAMCLELHSHKANKKTVLAELAKTLDLGRPRVEGIERHLELLTTVRDRLNQHATAMNSVVPGVELTPFQILGRLVSCYSSSIEPVPFIIPDLETWTRSVFEDRCGRLRQMESILKEIGHPREHPWLGVELMAPLLPSALPKLLREIQELRVTLESVHRNIQQLTTLLCVTPPDMVPLKWIGSLVRVAQQCRAAPPMDRSTSASTVWESQIDDIDRLVGHGEKLLRSRLSLSGKVTDEAWELDFTTVRRQIAIHGHSWFRIFRKSYRDAVALLRSVLTVLMPHSKEKRLEIVDALVDAQSARRVLSAVRHEVGESAFGALWKSVNSDFGALRAILDWDKAIRIARVQKICRKVMSRPTDLSAIGRIPEELEQSADLVRRQLKALVTQLRFKAKGLVDYAEIDDIPLAELIARVTRWSENGESLSKWIGYYIRRSEAATLGLGEVLDAFEAGYLSAEQLTERLSQAYFESAWQQILIRRPELAVFDGTSHRQMVQEFQTLDIDRIELARKEVALAHFSAIPQDSGRGEMAIIRGEIAKKRKHRSIRTLLRDAGHAALAIKPVFMMSPISVAQFLEPGVLQFDLLVMDEASQVTPQDSLGAVARCQQLVVVGDSKQLPPTQFFNTVLDEDVAADGAADSVNTSDMESVLGLCVARGLAQRMLRWHYRSRHHSLIAVSNREFYDSKLLVIPSPATADSGLGLKYRFVPDGSFDRGGTATNRVEARVVAEAVIDHARQTPNKSLGVAAFSVAQRDAIRDELELLLRETPGVDEFFSPGRPEPFFIKNLENIQGDERDCIFISVGYARDSSGVPHMNFGPLSSDGGERRLNVLISRAKERCEVFTSLTYGDIDLSRAKSRGAAALKAFLRFAEHGILDTQEQTGRAFDSEFEQQVAAALEREGLIIHPQIGTSGFVIDLGVVDPAFPGRYLLGIECDGATYHSSRSARDRDRLREQVLCDRGWNIHRIWSTDWFHRPTEQIAKVLEAVEQAKAAYFDPLPRPISPAVQGEAEREEIVRDPERDVRTAKPRTSLYKEAVLEVPSRTAIQEVSTRELAKIVTMIVAIEGPVHRDEVARRVVTLWGLQRVGARISSSIDNAIRHASRSSQVIDDDDFLTLPDQVTIPVRDRTDVASAGLRKIENLPPTEVRAAILMAAKDHVGLSRDEVASAVVQLLGFTNTTVRIKALIESQTTILLSSGSLSERNRRIYVGDVYLSEPC